MPRLHRLQHNSQAAASLGHTVASRPAAITVAQYEACQLELSLGAIVIDSDIDQKHVLV